MIRSAEDVIAAAKARGFSLRINPGPPPMPVLVCHGYKMKSEATEPLMEALKAWRVEIMEILSNETGSNGTH